MKRALSVLLLLLSWAFLFVPQVLADTCACYDTTGVCSKITSTEANCTTDCGTTLSGQSKSLSKAVFGSGSTEADVVAACDAAATATTTADTSGTYLTPTLNVNIPTISFSKIAKTGSVISINFIGEYVSGFYKYLLSISVIIAVIMIMIGGAQYVAAAGSGDVGKAKERIRNAVTGFILLMFVVLLMETVNPNLIFFKPLGISLVEQLALSADTQGDEGVGTTSNSLAKLPEKCKTMVDDAQASGTCKLSEEFSSPTGGAPLCGNHHWGDDGAKWNWANMKNLDYPAGWGQTIYAPFSGTVTYEKQTNTSNRCGNRIYLSGSGGYITICHAKDFIGGDGTFVASRTVKAGDVIGHLGGNCCSGQTPPADWSSAKKGWCSKSGTMCTDPTKSESCNCQPVAQSGNTSGPHVHVTWNMKGGDLLACLAE